MLIALLITIAVADLALVVYLLGRSRRLRPAMLSLSGGDQDAHSMGSLASATAGHDGNGRQSSKTRLPSPLQYGEHPLARPSPGPSVWRELEAEFRKVIDPGACMRADVYEENGGENTWTINNAFDDGAKERFQELALIAGRMLIESPDALSRFSAGTLMEADPVKRWLNAIRERDINYQRYLPGELVGEGNVVVGHSQAGSVSKVVQASALLCLQQVADVELHR